MPDKDRTYLRFCFNGSVSDPLPGSSLDREIIGTHWLAREMILQMTGALRSPMVLQCIGDYLEKKPLPLDVLHEVN